MSHFRIPKSSIPAAITHCCQVIQNNGYEALIVGGAVRDSLLQRPIQDYDLATNAPLSYLSQTFDTFNVGAVYGTLGLRLDSQVCQITQFRQDGPYSNSRQPDYVVKTQSIETDLSRRDFTINALAYDPVNHKGYDFHQGLSDLQHRRLRTVGDPRTRFQEDHLRILRAYRFMSQLGVTCDPDTQHAIRQVIKDFNAPSIERIGHELHRLIHGPAANVALRAMQDDGVLIAVLGPQQWPEFDEVLTLDPAQKMAYILQYVPYSAWRPFNLTKKETRWVKRLQGHQLNVTRARMRPSDLAISTDALLAMGFHGPELGAVQRSLMDAVAINPSQNNAEDLRSLIKHQFQR